MSRIYCVVSDRGPDKGQEIVIYRNFRACKAEVRFLRRRNIPATISKLSLGLLRAVRAWEMTFFYSSEVVFGRRPGRASAIFQAYRKRYMRPEEQAKEAEHFAWLAKVEGGEVRDD